MLPIANYAHIKNQTELLDTFDEKTEVTVDATVAAHDQDIGFGKAEFSWTIQLDTADNSEQVFRLHIEDDIIFEKGVLNLIYGPTACGKTSMLMALLGEMHYIPHGSDSWVNLPRSGGVAYASQESWVLSDTIKVFNFDLSQYELSADLRKGKYLVWVAIRRRTL